MKKLFMVAMAIVVATGFVACTKDDASAPTYKVEFTVGEKGGFEAGSRAVKTAWAAGDQIMVAFMPQGEVEYMVEGTTSNKLFVIEFNGSAWAAKRELTSEEFTAIGSKGNFVAVHYRVTGTDVLGVGMSGGPAYYLANYRGGEILEYKGNYTVADGVLALGNFDMSLAFGGDQFQVSVPGIGYEGSRPWRMSILDNTYVSGDYSGSKFGNIIHLRNGSAAFSTTNGAVSFGEYRRAEYVINGTNDASYVFRPNTSNDSDVAVYGKYKFFIMNEDLTKAYVYTVDRNFVDGAYQVTLEKGKAYVLPEFDGDGAQTNWKPVSLD